jgi:O-antigen biosynthesis protein WbqV
MIHLPTLTPRQMLIVAHDLFAVAAALVVTFVMRFEGAQLVDRLSGLVLFLPGFLLYAAVVFFVFRLERTKWRFTSIPDLFNIVKAVTVLAVSLLICDYVLLTPSFYGTFFFGKITIILYWFLQIFFLSGSRVVYRYFRYARTLKQAKVDGTQPTLVIGRAADAEVLLRAIESGAVRHVLPAGILSPSPADRGQSIRNVPVLGEPDDLERVVADLSGHGARIGRIILAPSALMPEARPEVMLMRARKLGVPLSQMPSLTAGGHAVQLAPVAVEDLLLRPSVEIDYGKLEQFVSGKSVVVTGGGGSIGSEICQRVAAFGAARLLIVENSEPAMYAVMEALAAGHAGENGSPDIEGHIADIRDRDRIMTLFAAFKPDIVFHAAALKHVPVLERDWEEGVKTNVFGSVNVADAAAGSGAAAMVMISTDKAVEPVSVLGVTKRFAEMYCQALDAEPQSPMRLISVRFGNVLASNGSVVPKFKAQIEAGGPITVTHRDMVRYFMTIREACDLVVTAATHALGPQRNGVSVYTLNMGQPVKILDLAERMIRLSGLEPHRDIEITFTGVRAGERLNEILFSTQEETADIGIPGIVAAKPLQLPLAAIRDWLSALDESIARCDRSESNRILRTVVPEFVGTKH